MYSHYSSQHHTHFPPIHISKVRARIQGRRVPLYQVRRHPLNWGFIMESCWVVWTSYLMPAAGAYVWFVVQCSAKELAQSFLFFLMTQGLCWRALPRALTTTVRGSYDVINLWSKAKTNCSKMRISRLQWKCSTTKQCTDTRLLLTLLLLLLLLLKRKEAQLDAPLPLSSCNSRFHYKI